LRQKVDLAVLMPVLAMEGGGDELFLFIKKPPLLTIAMKVF